MLLSACLLGEDKCILESKNDSDFRITFNKLNIVRQRKYTT